MTRLTRSTVRLSDEQRRHAEELLAQHGTGLWRIALVIGGSAHAAEDLLATALLRALPHLHRIEAPAPLYLRRVMLNLRSTEYRRRSIAAIVPGEVPDHPDHQDTAATIALRADVAAALAKLAPRQRAVVVLRYLEDRSAAETAAILGCTEETVRSQAHRALARLRADAPGLLSDGADRTTTSPGATPGTSTRSTR
jgi:RNA polymerase sigma-70 factor (sigma-E family)